MVCIGDWMVKSENLFLLFVIFGAIALVIIYSQNFFGQTVITSPGSSGTQLIWQYNPGTDWFGSQARDYLGTNGLKLTNIQYNILNPGTPRFSSCDTIAFIDGTVVSNFAYNCNSDGIHTGYRDGLVRVTADIIKEIPPALVPPPAPIIATPPPIIPIPPPPPTIQLPPIQGFAPSPQLSINELLPWIIGILAVALIALFIIKK